MQGVVPFASAAAAAAAAPVVHTMPVAARDSFFWFLDSNDVDDEEEHRQEALTSIVKKIGALSMDPAFSEVSTMNLENRRRMGAIARNPDLAMAMAIDRQFTTHHDPFFVLQEIGQELLAYERKHSKITEQEQDDKALTLFQMRDILLTLAGVTLENPQASSNAIVQQTVSRATQLTTVMRPILATGTIISTTMAGAAGGVIVVGKLGAWATLPIVVMSGIGFGAMGAVVGGVTVWHVFVPSLSELFPSYFHPSSSSSGSSSSSAAAASPASAFQAETVVDYNMALSIHRARNRIEAALSTGVVLFEPEPMPPAVHAAWDIQFPRAKDALYSASLELSVSALIRRPATFQETMDQFLDLLHQQKRESPFVHVVAAVLPSDHMEEAFWSQASIYARRILLASHSSSSSSSASLPRPPQEGDGVLREAGASASASSSSSSSPPPPPHAPQQPWPDLVFQWLTENLDLAVKLPTRLTVRMRDLCQIVRGRFERSTIHTIKNIATAEYEVYIQLLNGVEIDLRNATWNKANIATAVLAMIAAIKQGPRATGNAALASISIEIYMIWMLLQWLLRMACHIAKELESCFKSSEETARLQERMKKLRRVGFQGAIDEFTESLTTLRAMEETHRNDSAVLAARLTSLNQQLDFVQLAMQVNLLQPLPRKEQERLRTMCAKSHGVFTQWPDAYTMAAIRKEVGAPRTVLDCMVGAVQAGRALSVLFRCCKRRAQEHKKTNPPDSFVSNNNTGLSTSFLTTPGTLNSHLQGADLRVLQRMRLEMAARSLPPPPLRQEAHQFVGSAVPSPASASSYSRFHHYPYPPPPSPAVPHSGAVSYLSPEVPPRRRVQSDYGSPPPLYAPPPSSSVRGQSGPTGLLHRSIALHALQPGGEVDQALAKVRTRTLSTWAQAQKANPPLPLRRPFA